MNLSTRQEVLEMLNMPEESFRREILPLADAARQAAFGNRIRVMAMMGYTNICKNRCLYCGMRAGNAALPRYRVLPEQVLEMARQAAESGYGRLFLIAGEDPKYPFDQLLRVVRTLKEEGMWISMACGELTAAQFQELADAGVDEYVMKFEMSDPASFNRLNPSTTFEKRMGAIELIKSLGLRLASGNIVDWPGQTVEELAEDILLMKRLDIAWAPVIPYLPAAGTPLAQEGGRGSLFRLYQEIALLRLMMPDIQITAQQPGPDMRKGLSDPEGNLAAIHAGGSMLFFDLLPDAASRNFRVVDDRNLSGTGHLKRVAELGGLELDFGGSRQSA